MSIASILARCRSVGLELKVNGAQLELFSENDVPPGLIEAIRQNKPALLKSLGWKPVERKCGRHATFQTCIAPPVQQCSPGLCVCCLAKIPEDQCQCQKCHDEIKAVLVSETIRRMR